MAPPHTRGSTHTGAATIRARRGSPAHAGIDPNPLRRGHHWAGLPRTRGDRPLPPRSTRSATRAPPHTRGSTCLSLRCTSSECGSPAHAGIDPHRQTGRRVWRWLPRTRGDRPCEISPFRVPPTSVTTQGDSSEWVAPVVGHLLLLLVRQGGSVSASAVLAREGRGAKSACWTQRTTDGGSRQEDAPSLNCLSRFLQFVCGHEARTFGPTNCRRFRRPPEL